MRFRQLDHITELIPGQKLVGTRTLRPDEDYLRDHFPHFAVMPGVLMLEACYQAAMWMVKTGEDFASPLVLLREVKSVKFADFLAPGETLEIIAELVKDDGKQATVKATARKGERVSVSARLILERQSVPSPPQFNADNDVRMRAKRQFEEIFGPQPLGKTA